jgi:protein gp37
MTGEPCALKGASTVRGGMNGKGANYCYLANHLLHFEDHPTVEQERCKLWPLIEQTPMLNWVLLTKRPQNILQMVPWSGAFPHNVWIGTSVENQRRANERIPVLLAVPAVVRFLSCEPLLEAVDLSAWLPFLQWVIVGGESGAAARPMAPSAGSREHLCKTRRR